MPLDILHSPHNLIVVLLSLAILNSTFIICHKFQMYLDSMICVPIICYDRNHNSWNMGNQSTCLLYISNYDHTFVHCYILRTIHNLDIGLQLLTTLSFLTNFLQTYFCQGLRFYLTMSINCCKTPSFRTPTKIYFVQLGIFKGLLNFNSMHESKQ